MATKKERHFVTKEEATAMLEKDVGKTNVEKILHVLSRDGFTDSSRCKFSLDAINIVLKGVQKALGALKPIQFKTEDEEVPEAIESYLYFFDHNAWQKDKVMGKDNDLEYAVEFALNYLVQTKKQMDRLTGEGRDYLTEDQLKRAIKDILPSNLKGEKLEKRRHEFYNKFDLDHNGRLDKNEFADFFLTYITTPF